MLDKAVAEQNLSLVVLGGPGDPLATPETTLAAIKAIRQRHSTLQIGLSTLGLGSRKLAQELARAGLNRIELQVEALRAEVLEKLFAWIRPGRKTIKLAEGAKILVAEQREAVSALKFNELEVSIRTTLYPGYNHDHLGKIAREMRELGADTMAVVPYRPTPGTEVELAPPDPALVASTTNEAAQYLPLVAPLFDDSSKEDCEQDSTKERNFLPSPSKERPKVAVASSNGIEVDLHLGHAIRFLIYGPRSDGLACLLETRDAPKPGKGAHRWQELAAVLADCFAVMVASAGEKPRKILAENGLEIIRSEENIEGLVDVLYGGGKKGKKQRRQQQV